MRLRHCAAPTYEKDGVGQNRGTLRHALPLSTFAHRALNRAVALAKLWGPEEGLAELRKTLPSSKEYPFYPAAQGEFHLLAGRPRRGNTLKKP